jgi:rod shape-determining protein MreC
VVTVFLLLWCSLTLTIQSHSFQNKIISSAIFLSGGVYEKGECSKRVFKFKTQNDALALENT